MEEEKRREASTPARSGVGGGVAATIAGAIVVVVGQLLVGRGTIDSIDGAAAVALTGALTAVLSAIGTWGRDRKASGSTNVVHYLAAAIGCVAMMVVVPGCAGPGKLDPIITGQEEVATPKTPSEAATMAFFLLGAQVNIIEYVMRSPGLVKDQDDRKSIKKASDGIVTAMDEAARFAASNQPEWDDAAKQAVWQGLHYYAEVEALLPEAYRGVFRRSTDALLLGMR